MTKMRVYYECQRCGACCQWPGLVKVSIPEIVRMAEYLDLSEKEFIENFTQLRPDRQGLALVDQASGACVFFQKGFCTVHSVKPQQCRDFPNLWHPADFRDRCQARPREVVAEEWNRLVSADTGRDLTETTAVPKARGPMVPSGK